MPKLSARQTAMVDEAEVSQGFEAWPAGRYLAVVDGVEEKDSQAGNPMWNITFRDFRDASGEKYRGRQWYRLMLPQTKMPKDYLPVKMRDQGLTVAEVLEDDDLSEDREKAWKNYQNMVSGRIKQYFQAFGLTNDSDAEETVDQEVVVILTQVTQQVGKNAGKLTNEVDGVAPVEGSEFDNESDNPDF